MKPSDLMASQLTDVKQTLSMSLLKSAQNTQIAQASMILDDFEKTQEQLQATDIKPAPHPYAGQNVDIQK